MYVQHALPSLLSLHFLSLRRVLTKKLTLTLFLSLPLAPATPTPNRPSSEQLSTTSLFESSDSALTILFVRRPGRIYTRWEEQESYLVGARPGWRS